MVVLFNNKNKINKIKKKGRAQSDRSRMREILRILMEVSVKLCCANRVSVIYVRNVVQYISSAVLRTITSIVHKY